MMSITKSANEDRYHDLYAGLIRLHILHHAVEGPVFGLAMIDELGRHGYRISAGTLYPLLKGMEKHGYLRSSQERNGRSLRKMYRATPLGRQALKAMKIKLGELFGEINESKSQAQQNSVASRLAGDARNGAGQRRTSFSNRRSGADRI